MRWLLPIITLTGCATAEPTLDAVSPGAVCAAQPDALTLTGTGLSPTIVGGLGEDPQLYLPAVLLSQGEHTILLEGDDEQLRWVSDGELSVVLSTGLAAGTWDVAVYRADGSSATLPAALDALARPSLSVAEPTSLCHTRTDAPLRLVGGGMASIDGVMPTVTVADLSATVTGTEDCQPTDGPLDVSLCEALTATVDATALPLGWVEVTLLNPDPASCGGVSTTVEVRAAPTLSAVEPELLCSAGGELTITGADLREDTTVSIGGLEASLVRYIDSTTMTVLLPEGLPTGSHDVVITSPGGCGDTLPSAVEVVSTPLAYTTTPAALPEGRSAVVMVFVANVIDEVVEVWLEDEDGASHAVDWTWSAAEPGLVEVVVPDDLAAGIYRVGVALAGSCAGASSALLSIVDQLTVAIASVEPGYTWTFDDTAVEIYAEAPLPAGMTDFEETPTATLIATDGEATALTGLTWRSGGRLTATVPAGLASGSYDLLVENPDGALGMLAGAVTVTTSAPPNITAVRPLSLSTSKDTILTISGQEFRDPEVWLECRDGSTAAATVLSWSYSELAVEVASSRLGQTVCVLEVTNSDGTAARYASVSVTNPASNLFPWSAGPDLNIARRAPAVGAGRVDAVSRYLYALGGDGGAPESALDSIEQALVGVYGDLSDWTLLSATLPGPRTLAGLGVVGRYLYLVGGDDGKGALDEVWRAQILSRRDAPQMLTPTMYLSSDGLTEGRWQYAVSALYDTTDEINPSGESLISERLTLQLPALDGDRYQPRLSWTATSDAVGYRVYRSLSADSDTLGWIADVTDTELTDTALPPDAALPPLEEGELGEWVQLDAMTTPRSAACLTIAADPIPDPQRVYLYMAGGMDDSGAALDSIERLEITVTSERTQTAGSWSLSDVTLSEARYACGASTISADYHTVVDPGEDWVLFVGGVDDRGRAVGTVDAGRVQEDGDLSDWQETDSMSPARAGFGHASASDFLYVFGGQQFRPSAGGVSAGVSSPMPEIDNWNSLGTSLSETRLLPGSAQESSVIFVIGGETDTAGATTSTDWTNY
jgi:hypothetical protein